MPQSRDEKLARTLRDRQLAEVMSTPAGQKLVWRIITNVAGVFSSSFSTNQSVAAFNEGKRAVGLALMKEVQRVAPLRYLEMTAERINTEMQELAIVKAEAARDAASSDETSPD